MQLGIILPVAAIAVFALTASVQKPASQPGQKASATDSSHSQSASADDAFVVQSNLVFLPTRVQRKNGETIYGLSPEQIIE
jgi:hypothetical protein